MGADPRRARHAIRPTLLILFGAALAGAVSLLCRNLDASSLGELRKAQLEAIAYRAESARLMAERMRRKAEAGRIALFNETEREVEELRELEFLRPVEYEFLGQEEVREVIRALLRKHYPPEQIERYGELLSTIGLIPSGLDLEEIYLSLLDEQLAAFYDQLRGKLVMFREADPRAFPTRVILAHELVHALQDQHFDLQKLPLTATDHDDRAMAAAALVEGDATLVMDWFSSERMSAWNIGQMLGSALNTPTRQLARSPRFLRESLLFPYTYGRVFAERLYEEGGFEALAEAYANPPRSTSEILHPHLYGRIDLRENWPTPTLDGFGPPVQNTLGEFSIRVWFDLWVGHGSPAGVQASKGWRGDRILGYFRDGGEKHVAWLTWWESERDAREFLKLAHAALVSRYEPTAPGTGGAPGNLKEMEQGIEFDAPRAVRLVHQGLGVALIDAADPATRDRLADALSGWAEVPQAGHRLPEEADPREEP